MDKKIGTKKPTAISMPSHVEGREFTDAKAAVQALSVLYERNTKFLRDAFDRVARGEERDTMHFRAFYPEVRLSTSSYAQIDSRLAFGHVSAPGQYTATITRPDLFDHYLEEQIRLLIRNHGGPVTVQESKHRSPSTLPSLRGHMSNSP